MPLIEVRLIHYHIVKVLTLKESAAAEDDLVLEIDQARRTPKRRSGSFDTLGDSCGIFTKQV